MIDWVRIADLKSEIGEGDFAEVVELFLVEMEEVVTRLRTAPDPVTYEADLHFLKGGAWNLGFAGFGAICEDGERKSAANRNAEIDIAAVVESYELSKVEFFGNPVSGGTGGISSAA